ncbi:hypothetical protein E0H73_15610 [Kribbella pittospori]|uniref:Uncharacterized protein n=1 Tax=Kribbella pittospori TaxID=722689 RepID=A0A4R0KSQ7_9ACTN|nr:hypothetical protein [Kribbella pittospori]TCC62136.1 hypothetical protein E0H73_15610 [Kribbella pittospori]
MKRMRRAALAIAGVGLLAAAAVPATAATPKPDNYRATGKSAGKLPTTKAQAATAACGMGVGAVNAVGTAGGYDITATRPPSVLPLETFKLFNVRASTTWYFTDGAQQDYYSSLILQGSNLYGSIVSYNDVAPDPDLATVKLGTGWTSFRAIASSNYVLGAAPHSFLYGLHSNGSLYRYTVGETVRAFGSAPGFGTVKAMTLIAETASYDTLLVSLTGGSLYTVRVPVTNPMKPIVKKVRSTGFAAYESLIAQRCGAASTLLSAFDNDTKTVTVYAVSRATGESTVINNYGSAPATFGGTASFLLTGDAGPQLVGE